MRDETARSLAPRPKALPRRRGFSIVEVVLAIGVFALVVLPIVGLLGMGLSGNRSSDRLIDAANITAQIVSLRRAAPFHAFSTEWRFVLPPLNTADEEPVEDSRLIAQDGSVAGSPDDVRYACAFRIARDETQPDLYLVRVRLSWPPAAASSTGARGDHFETSTAIFATVN